MKTKQIVLHYMLSLREFQLDIPCEQSAGAVISNLRYAK